MNKCIFVPFTEEQVKALNRHQSLSCVHPFTCGSENCREILIATTEGWICPKCDYRQYWAHRCMADEESLDQVEESHNHLMAMLQGHKHD